MKISRSVSNFEAESFLAPFGFKGGYINGAWQTGISLESPSGAKGIGVGTQGVLWSDAKVFSSTSEAEGNAMMYLLSAYSARKAMELEWDTPVDLVDQLLPITYEHAKIVTGNPNLRLTFALNSLVSVDNAAWQLYAHENGFDSFNAMIPEAYRAALPCRHDKIVNIPLMSYGVKMPEIEQAIADGYFLLKIKIGADPDKDGDYGKMLAWDMQRLTDIHEAAKSCETPYTDSGKLPYYLDANGRYDSKDRLLRLLDHADKIGALEQIVIVEEPFPEENQEDVSDIPARLAADESAHSDKDALARIQQGYGAIALKPIAKTLSMSLKIAELARQNNTACFCADLTVCPLLVDWNKNVAGRLPALPGIKIGAVESNGHQNYKNWETMKSYHPCYDAPWLTPVNGIFQLDDDFYAKSGGILEMSQHFLDML